VVFDAVYTPKWTRLLQEAEATGALVVCGMEMFIRQAMGRFELSTGCKGAAPEKMKDANIAINWARISTMPRGVKLRISAMSMILCLAS
jgi:shikimate 5-dehydrogenase